MVAGGRAAAAQPVPAAAAPAQERAGPPVAPSKPEPLRLDSLFAGVWLPADDEEDAEDMASDSCGQLGAAAGTNGAGAPAPSLQGSPHAAVASLSNGARDANGAPPAAPAHTRRASNRACMECNQREKQWRLRMHEGSAVYALACASVLAASLSARLLAGCVQ